MATPKLLEIMQEHGLQQKDLVPVVEVNNRTINYHIQALRRGECRLRLDEMRAIARWVEEETGERHTVEELFAVPEQETA